MCKYPHPHRHIIFVFVILFLTSFEKVSSISSPRQQKVTKYVSHDVVLQKNKPPTTTNVSFLPVVYVAIINSVVNVIRPGEFMIFLIYIDNITTCNL